MSKKDVASNTILAIKDLAKDLGAVEERVSNEHADGTKLRISMLDKFKESERRITRLEGRIRELEQANHG